MVKETNAKDKKTEKGLIDVENTLTTFEIFFEKNRKTITYSVLGVIGVFLLLFGYYKFVHQPKAEQAHEQMFMAEYYFSVDSLDLALNGDGVNLGFYDIISNFRRTPASNLANYYTGMILMKKGEFEQAMKHLKRFDSNDQILSSMALGAIGDAYVELGNLQNAAKYYLKAADKNKNEFVGPLFLSKAAWTTEQLGDKEEALKLYTDLFNQYFRTQEGQEAERHIARLEAELKK